MPFDSQLIFKVIREENKKPLDLAKILPGEESAFGAFYVRLENSTLLKQDIDVIEQYIEEATPTSQNYARRLWLEGLLYEHGINRRKDLSKAFNCYLLSHTAGEIEGSVKLGICYAQGIGHLPEKSEAEKLFSFAAEKNHQFAPYFLDKLKNDSVAMETALADLLSTLAVGTTRALLLTGEYHEKNGDLATAREAYNLAFKLNDEKALAKLGYPFSESNIQQGCLILQLQKYLVARGRLAINPKTLEPEPNLRLLHTPGYCSGLMQLWFIMKMRGLEKDHIQTLEKIAGWNGKDWNEIEIAAEKILNWINYLQLNHRYTTEKSRQFNIPEYERVLDEGQVKKEVINVTLPESPLFPTILLTLARLYDGKTLRDPCNIDIKYFNKDSKRVGHSIGIYRDEMGFHVYDGNCRSGPALFRNIAEATFFIMQQFKILYLQSDYDIYINKLTAEGNEISKTAQSLAYSITKGTSPIDTLLYLLGKTAITQACFLECLHFDPTMLMASLNSGVPGLLRIIKTNNFRLVQQILTDSLECAFINERDNITGETSLSYAVATDNTKMAELLLRHGASIIMANLKVAPRISSAYSSIKMPRKSLLAQAIDNKNVSMIQLLISYGHEVTANDLGHAFTIEHKEIIDLLTEVLTYIHKHKRLKPDANCLIPSYIGSYMHASFLFDLAEAQEELKVKLHHEYAPVVVLDLRRKQDLLQQLRREYSKDFKNPEARSLEIIDITNPSKRYEKKRSIA